MRREIGVIRPKKTAIENAYYGRDQGKMYCFFQYTIYEITLDIRLWIPWTRLII